MNNENVLYLATWVYTMLIVTSCAKFHVHPQKNVKMNGRYNNDMINRGITMYIKLIRRHCQMSFFPLFFIWIKGEGICHVLCVIGCLCGILGLTCNIICIFASDLARKFSLQRKCFVIYFLLIPMLAFAIHEILVLTLIVHYLLLFSMKILCYQNLLKCYDKCVHHTITSHHFHPWFKLLSDDRIALTSHAIVIISN